MDRATPRPWYADDGRVWGDVQTSDRTGAAVFVHKVCDTAFHAEGGFEEQRANAALITRAVNSYEALLTACVKVRQELIDCDFAEFTIDELTAAIAKATGG